ncbi:hypothetical protein LINGRAHAP2_LOCUS32043 [Linum grandiflorum]
MLRRWRPGITPLAFAPEKKPMWIVLWAVPPSLLSLEGISWLASHYGTPIHQHIRDGFDVRVYVLRAFATNDKPELIIQFEESGPHTIKVEFLKSRVYKHTGVEK